MYTHYDIISIPASTDGAPGLAARITAAIADDWQPLGAAFPDGQGNICQTIVKGTIVGTLEDLTARVDDLETFQTAATSDIDDLETFQDAQTTRNTAVDTWANALVDKLNADHAEANVASDFPLTLDTNYDDTI